MAIQIFISYRREGGDFTALNMYQALRERGYDVFYDVESLRSGKFSKKLLDKIKECTDFVLILPPRALDRCVNEDDWVRLEVECAIENNKNIIPIMLRGFSFPTNLPVSLKDLPDYNGIPASAEDFEYVIDRLEKKFLKSSSKREYEEDNPKIVKTDDVFSKVEKALDEGGFDWVIERLGNLETNPEFSRVSPQEKGKLYKYLLWAERGMRWSDDPHKALVEPFYGPNYSAACRYGHKEELELINRSILKNIHDFVEMKVDLNNKVPYMIDDPAQCGGDYRYLWECILFKTQNFTYTEMKEGAFGGQYLSIGVEERKRMWIISKFIDEFRNVCPKWLYNGNEGVIHSKRYQEFLARLEHYMQEQGNNAQDIYEAYVFHNILYLLFLSSSLLLQVIVLSFGWKYFHTLSNKDVLPNVCMYVYMLGIMIWSMILDWKLVKHIGRLPKLGMDNALCLLVVSNVMPIVGLICCLLPIQFRIFDLFDSAQKWSLFAGYMLINAFSGLYGLSREGRLGEKVSYRQVKQEQQIKKSIAAWRRDLTNQ